MSGFRTTCKRVCDLCLTMLSACVQRGVHCYSVVNTGCYMVEYTLVCCLRCQICTVRFAGFVNGLHVLDVIIHVPIVV